MGRSPLVSLVVCAVTALTACAHRPRGPDGSPVWWEVRSPHFVLRADTGEEAAQRVARKLERIRAGLLAAVWHSADADPGTLQVLVLEKADSFAAYGFPHNVGGLTLTGQYGDVVLFVSADDSEDAATLKHELSHAIANNVLLRQPPWLSEGMASYLETLELHSDSVTVGAENLRRRGAALRVPIPFRLVLSNGFGFDQSEQAISGLYGRSWLLFHLLANNHWEGLEELIDRLASAEEPGHAFERAFPGLTPALLEREAEEYERGGSYEVRRFALPPADAPLVHRTLSQAEVLLARAQLLQAGMELDPKWRTLAVSAAAAARVADPTDPAAAELWIEVAGIDPAHRTRITRELTRLRPGEWRAWWLLAEALRGPGFLAERAAAAAEAARLAPAEPRVLVTLAQARAEEGKLDAALAAAQEAAQRAPGRTEAHAILAAVHAERGECAAASRAGERALEVVPDRVPQSKRLQLREGVRSLAQRCDLIARSKLPTEPPRLVTCAAPLPRSTRRQAGEIRVRYRVRPDGSVLGVEPQGAADPALAAPVVAHYQSCRFEPATQGGEPIEATMEAVVRFGPSAGGRGTR